MRAEQLCELKGMIGNMPQVAITPQGVVTPAGALPRIKSFTVSGIFELGMYEFDSGLVFVNIEDAEKLYERYIPAITLTESAMDDAQVAAVAIAKTR